MLLIEHFDAKISIQVNVLPVWQCFVDRMI